MSQERDVHSGPSFIVPPFAQRCFDAGAQLWSKSFKHPFVVHLLDGSLDEERFRYYQMQDARYLEVFADVCSILSTRTYDPETKLWFIDGARMAILVERSLHENYGRRLGYSSDDIAALSLSPNNRAYQNHLLGVTHQGSMLEAVAALAPCPWLYADIGQTIISSGTLIDDGHPYADWIREYSDPVFVEYTNDLLAHLQHFADRSSDEEEKSRAVENFVLSTRYELMFWEQAWDQQCWPDEDTIEHRSSVTRSI
jgi:thiaminase/transcriptional activator TenA